jgi:zinc/manganese transport system substrate-binding protein
MLSLRTLLALTTAAGLVGCAPTTQDAARTVAATPSATTGAPIPVVASTNVYGDLISRIAGDRVSVTTFISDPSQDPHSYQADVRNQLAISHARLVVENGGGYDDFVDTMLKAAPAADRQVLNVVDISGHTAPAGGDLNEHVWYDVGTVEVLVGRLADALAALDPADATTFRANAADLRTAIAGLEARENALRSKVNGQAVGITEPVPLYLLTACGLTNATPAEFSEGIEEGTDVPVVVLQETLDLYRDHKVRALIYNSQTSGPQTEQVRDAATSAGIPVVAVTETLPDGMDYVSWMSHNLDALEAALS